MTFFMRLVGTQVCGALLILLSILYSQSVYSQDIAALNFDDNTEEKMFGAMMQDFNHREVKQGFLRLDALIQLYPNQLSLYRLALMMGAKFDDYNVIFDSVDAILQRDPNDLQALYFKAIYSRAFMRNDYVQWRDQMASLQPDIAKKLDKLVSEVEAIWQKPVQYTIADIDPKGLGIIALGSPAKEDGTPKERLFNTLTRTLALANTYPNAPIFVTGAAVYTSMTESQAMKHWLVEKGVDESRIIIEDKATDTIGNAMNILPILKRKSVNKVLLVTVSYHMRRAYLIINGVFKHQQRHYTLLSAAAESDLIGRVLKQRLQVEEVSSYRDLSRAYDLFDVQDFYGERF